MSKYRAFMAGLITAEILSFCLFLRWLL